MNAIRKNPGQQGMLPRPASAKRVEERKEIDG